ncbi:hypothetical protein [Pseudomonas citronellolis]|uniref:hypothetical protein n=1 Tax=Pseudomonas citronellolis TaxID=53408 RepID=UPI000A95F331|nr:hypothetical protein [Pseudomonas citronellolis]
MNRVVSDLDKQRFYSFLDFFFYSISMYLQGKGIDKTRILDGVRSYGEIIRRNRLDGLACWVADINTPRLEVYQRCWEIQRKYIEGLFLEIGSSSCDLAIYKGSEFAESIFDGHAVALRGDTDLICAPYLSSLVLEILNDFGFKESYFDSISGSLKPLPRKWLESRANFNLGSYALAVPLNLSLEESSCFKKWERPLFNKGLNSSYLVVFDLATGLDDRIGYLDLNGGRNLGWGEVRALNITDQFWYCCSVLGYALLAGDQNIRLLKLAEQVALLTRYYHEIDWERVSTNIKRYGLLPVYWPIFKFILSFTSYEIPFYLREHEKGGVRGINNFSDFYAYR